jgi:hypothetical protein
MMKSQDNEKYFIRACQEAIFYLDLAKEMAMVRETFKPESQSYNWQAAARCLLIVCKLGSRVHLLSSSAPCLHHRLIRGSKCYHVASINPACLSHHGDTQSRVVFSSTETLSEI